MRPTAWRAESPSSITAASWPRARRRSSKHTRKPTHSSRRSWRSPVRRFATSARMRPTRCARSRGCGGDEVSAIYILWLREIKRYSRSRAQIIASLGQPLLYLLALGFGLGPVFEKAGQGSYLQFVAPGVIGMSVLFSSIFSGIGLLWDRQFGFLKETLVAPVPRLHIMIGRTLGGATVSMIQGLLVIVICLIAGFRPQHFSSLPMAIVFMAFISIVFAALGTTIGSRLQNMQGFQLIMNFLVMPIFFLSGALYPLNNLPRGLKIATRIDPLTYGIDGLRGAFIGVSHFSAATNVAVMSVVAVVFLALGAQSFSKIQV